MNYFMKCQLLSEGFKHEQLIEEDWEKLKKELTDLYVAGKITERQVSTRLTRAGMGPVAKNVAYKIAHDPENFQKREAVFSRMRKEEEEKAKNEAKAAQAAKHQTRGFAAANYNSQANIDAWLKASNEYIARTEKERAAKRMSLRESFSEEEVNYIMENIYMDNEELKCLLEDTAQYLLENNGPKKFVKGLKKAALGVAAAGTLAAVPGVVGGVKNVKRQADYRAMDEVGNAYNREMKQKEINARQNEIARNLHNTGVKFVDSTKEAGKNAVNAAKCLSEVSKICRDYSNNPDDPEIDNRVQSCIDKYGVDAYSRSLQAIITGNDFANATKSTAKKLANKVKGMFGKKTQVNEEVNYFNY